MKKENIYHKRMLHLLAIFMLLLAPLLSLTPKAAAQAADSQRSGVDNPAYTFTSTDGSSISTTANPNETTVLIFGHTKCGDTRGTLSSISSCDWVKRSDIRVIFAEINGHTQEEVLAYEQGYQCPEMTFCYDTTIVGINNAMYKYAELFGINLRDGVDLPMIVLIDKDNKVQNLLTGKKTADELLAEINKLTGDSSGTDTPPTDSDVGFANFAYGLKTIDNTIVSTKADPTKTTVLLFGNVFCSITNATLQEIYNSSWVSSQDIRIIFADVMGNTLDDTKTFAQNFAGKGISFCHDESALNFNFALSYLSLYGHNGGTFPYIVLIDKNDRIRCLTLGYQSADDIYKEIEKIKNVTPETPNTPETPETPETPNTPETPMTISNVTGLKASSSTAKSVKLTWTKIPAAKGYIIYQYNNTKKTWDTKATLTQNTNSYIVKGLASGAAYHFAVKAYIQSKDGKQAVSEAYASAYTATAPGTVNFKVTPGKKKAILKWSKVKGATGYTIYYKTNKQKSWKKLKNTKATRYTKTRLKSGTTYTFTVKAFKTYKGKTYTSSFRSKKVTIR